jgi:PhnB protein
MEITPHLSFNGDCEAAFKFYEQCLGGKISFLMTYADSPIAGQFPSEMAKKIMHASFAMGERMFSGADVVPEQYQTPQGIVIALNLKDPTEADRIFTALAEGGTVQMPIQETFWASRFGVLGDRFGTPWMINCEKQ